MACSFKTELLEAWDNIRDARLDGVWKPGEILRVFGDIADAVGAICGSLTSDADFEQLVLDTEWLVSTYVVPYNITKRPIIEAIIDGQMPGLVRPMLVALRGLVPPDAPNLDTSN